MLYSENKLESWAYIYVIQCGNDVRPVNNISNTEIFSFIAVRLQILFMYRIKKHV